MADCPGCPPGGKNFGHFAPVGPESIGFHPSQCRISIHSPAGNIEKGTLGKRGALQATPRLPVLGLPIFCEGTLQKGTAELLGLDSRGVWGMRNSRVGQRNCWPLPFRLISLLQINTELEAQCVTSLFKTFLRGFMSIRARAQMFWRL